MENKRKFGVTKNKFGGAEKYSPFFFDSIISERDMLIGWGFSTKRFIKFSVFNSPVSSGFAYWMAREVSATFASVGLCSTSKSNCLSLRAQRWIRARGFETNLLKISLTARLSVTNVKRHPTR